MGCVQAVEGAAQPPERAHEEPEEETTRVPEPAFGGADEEGESVYIYLVVLRGRLRLRRSCFPCA